MATSEWAPIPAAAAGADMGRRTVEITKRMTMAYAAGIGAVDPAFLDDARPGGVVAPLSLSASLEWPMMITPGYLAAIGRDSATVYDGLVHAFQDTRYFRPLRPGMSVEVEGKVTGVTATPAGALVVCKIVTTERKSGEPVAESWFGSMFRNTAVSGADIALETPPSLRSRPEVSGEAVERIPIDVPKGMAHVYTECADIWNPIHTEREFALASGLPDIILHGTCTLALAMQRLASRLRPDSELPFIRVATRFSRMVIPGAPISVEFDPTDADRVAFDVRNSAGELALTHGVIVLG